MIKKFFIAIPVLFLLLAVLILRPVPIVTEDKAIAESGVVAGIYEGGVNDVVFKLQDNNRRFYINRGLEAGLTLEGLREKLIGRKVTLKYPKYWTPLDWNNRVKHISKVEFGNEVIFNEFKPGKND